MRANYTYQELSIAQVVPGDSVIVPGDYFADNKPVSGIVAHITPTNKGDRLRVHFTAGNGQGLLLHPDTNTRVARAN